MSSSTSSGIPPLASRHSSILLGELDPNTEIFGVTLAKAMTLEEGRTLLASQDIPTLLDLILCNLEFKVIDAEVFVNSNPDSEAVTALRDRLNKGTLPTTINSEPDVLSGLLRRYLQELPEPLIPVSYFKQVLSILHSSKKFKNGKDRGGVAAIKEIFESPDFSRVHYNALRRVCNLMRTMLTSWWSDSNESSKILDIMALNILRPDNLNRAATSHKEYGQIKEAVSNLINHCQAIFVQTDSAARRISMIRKGERASRLQLFSDENASNPESARARRLSSVSMSDLPRPDLELRAEFKSFREQANLQIQELTKTVSSLKAELAEMRKFMDRMKRHSGDEFASANGSEELNDTPPITPKTRRTDSGSKMLVTVMSTDSPRKRSSNRSLEVTERKSSSRALDAPSKRDSKKSMRSDTTEDSKEEKKHKSKK